MNKQKEPKKSKEDIRKEETDGAFWQGWSDSYYHWNRKIDKRIEELERITGISELRKLKKEMNKK